MLAQYFNHSFHFMPDFLLKQVVLWVGGTAHSKVLPDQYAMAVAEVKKPLILVNTAAPAAYHIAVAFP